MHKVFQRKFESLSADCMQTTDIRTEHANRRRLQSAIKGLANGQIIGGISDKPPIKIGFLSFPVTGHLNSMTALARKLQSRGHEVVFIGVPDVERVIRAADLAYLFLGRFFVTLHAVTSRDQSARPREHC
jgi:hypothetical protein